MPFFSEPDETKTFDKFDALCEYAGKEKVRLRRLPLPELLQEGASFYDDHSFGSPSRTLQFTNEGIRSLCHALHVPFTLVTSLEKSGLATDVLNDVLRRADSLATLQDLEFATDSERNLIVGTVSRSYVTYSNRDLLRDLETVAKPPAGNARTPLTFETAIVTNTHLRARFCSTLEAGVVRGKGGSAPDRAIIGFQFVNSMVGDTAVRVDFYLHRLICANGIIAPVSHTQNVVFHSGKERTFLARLDERFSAIVRGIGRIQELWQGLADIPFNPHALARTGCTSDILDLFPEHRDTLRQYGADADIPDELSREEKRLRREAVTLAAIPKVLASGDSARVFQSCWRDNQTLFDFINLFTEKAQEYSDPNRRIQVEENAGRLADRLFQNRKKLASLN